MSSSTFSARPYFSTSGSVVTSDKTLPLDNDWVRSSFLITLSDFSSSSNFVTDQYVLKYVYWSTAELKFTNTSMGGNLGVNAKPQFCRYSDIRIKGIMPGRNDVSITSMVGNNGMGRFYSEAFDDNAQRIYMQFGVPQFNSMLNFLSTMFDSNLSALATTGSGPSILYYASKTIASISSIIYFFPMSALFIGVNMVMSTITNKSISSFYSMRPTMPTYWSAVNEMVNAISVLRGILPPSMMNATHLSPGTNDFTLNQQVLESLRDLMPDVINKDYGIDVFAMQGRIQSLQNAIKIKYAGSAYDIPPQTTDASGYYTDALSSGLTTDQFLTDARTAIASAPARKNLAQFIQKYNETVSQTAIGSQAPKLMRDSPMLMWTLDPNKIDGSNQSTAGSINTPTADQTQTATNSYQQGADNNATGADGGGISASIQQTGAVVDGYGPDKASKTYIDSTGSFAEKIKDYFMAQAESGGGYACFIVEHTGSISDSFSNDFQDSGLATSLNSISSAARSLTFNVADGNVIPGLGSLISGAKDVLYGTLDGIHLGGLARLLLGTYMVDIPKFWSGSAASLGKSDYTLDLVSPYGNAMSQLQNLYIPLAMVLTGGLPLSAGRQTYTSPFLCQLFDRGRSHVTLGMIDSVNITRGTTNLAFNKEFRPLGFKVSFSVVNLNNIMHVPITKGTFFGAVQSAIAAGVSDLVTNLSGSLTAGEIAGGFVATSLTDDDGILFNYLAAVTGLSAQDSLYKISKARISLAMSYKSRDTLTSPAAWANRFVDLANSNFISGPIMSFLSAVNVAAMIQAPANLNGSSPATGPTLFPG